jgi:hypothetical protein
MPTFGICLGHQIMAWPWAPRPSRWPTATTAPTTRCGPGQRPRQHHQPEPRLRGGHGQPAGQRARHAHQPVRRHAARLRVQGQPAFCFQGTPRRRPARRTSATCSTASSR